ncbi:MAG: hypothetical protein ABL951_01215 [Alphaproteobacteria bacterium]
MAPLPNMEGVAQRLFALKRFVLLVGDAGAMIARLSGSRVVAHQFLDGDLEDNVRRAKLTLAEFPKYPVILLFDVLGQSYRRDRLPPVNMLDRPKIVARKLEALFPGIEFKGGLRLGPTEGDIRGFDYLFAAVSTSPEIVAWQAMLGQIENPTSDVRLLPVESVKLLHRLMHKSNGNGNGNGARKGQWNILISQHRTGGFRQIVTRGHTLAIARMTSGFVDIESPGEIAALLQREIGATIDYITRLGFDRAEGLNAVFIGRSDIGATLKNVQLPVRSLTAFTPAEAQYKTGITGASDDSGHFADLLHAAWGGSRFLPALSIWPQKIRRQRALALAQSWGTRMLAAASVAGFLYGANLLWEIRRAEAEYSLADSSRGALQQRYDAEITKLDGGTMPIARMRDIIAIHAQLAAADVDLNRLYNAIGAGLSGNAKLRSLDIEIEQPVTVLAPAPDQSGPGGVQSEPAPVEADIILNLDLSSFRDAEQAVGEAGRMTRALRLALPDMQIKILRQPLRILPGDTLTVKPGENVLAFSGEDRTAKIQLIGRVK